LLASANQPNVQVLADIDDDADTDDAEELPQGGGGAGFADHSPAEIQCLLRVQQLLDTVGDDDPKLNEVLAYLNGTKPGLTEPWCERGCILFSQYYSTAYWLGSSQYAQKDNRGALTTLQGYVQKYPEHARVPEALLIIGTCQADLGDRKAAADTYRTLNQQYPDSPAAASARERLAALNTAAAPTPPPTQPSAPAPAVTQPSPPAAPTAPAAPAAKPPTKR
jgi:tetratricopeptide (TPR) repeat protein